MRWVLTLAIAVAALSACSVPGGAAHTNLVVDFTTATASTARATVRAHCGSLPGIATVPARPMDASVYFDIQHASNRQINALDSCINALQTANPALGIRGYRITDGDGT